MARAYCAAIGAGYTDDEIEEKINELGCTSKRKKRRLTEDAQAEEALMAENAEALNAVGRMVEELRVDERQLLANNAVLDDQANVVQLAAQVAGAVGTILTAIGKIPLFGRVPRILKTGASILAGTARFRLERIEGQIAANDARANALREVIVREAANNARFRQTGTGLR